MRLYRNWYLLEFLLNLINPFHEFNKNYIHFHLFLNLLTYVFRKFIGANIDTLQEINCMKNVLDHLMSVHAKYRIASELGFTDIVEDLLRSGQLAYLKDTVWKKGYRSED